VKEKWPHVRLASLLRRCFLMKILL
jgi:hypothetical protein